VDHRAGGQPPYGTVSVLVSLAVTRSSTLGPYVRGRLALADFDLRGDCGGWLDAVYAILADAPHEIIEQLNKRLIVAGTRAAPDPDTWGLLPEHQSMAGTFAAAQEAPVMPDRGPTAQPAR
jgi:hypothetical protein